MGLGLGCVGMAVGRGWRCVKQEAAVIGWGGGGGMCAIKLRYPGGWRVGVLFLGNLQRRGCVA